MRWMTVLALASAATLIGCDNSEPAASKPAAPPPAKPGTNAGEARVVVVTDATFKSEVLEAKEPVLVDLWATWCGPCVRAAPTVKALAAEYAGRAKVCKIDFDANPAAARQYGGQGIPVFVVFKGGKEVHRSVGFASDAQLRQDLSAALDAALKN
ncbi:MAG: thioredoxin family protein [Phycisphaerales bacterium]